MNRGGIADIPLLITLLAICQKSWEASFWEVMDSFCFITICKFGSFKNPFVGITSLLEFYFRFRRFILLIQTKKVISMNYGSSTSSWKPWRWAISEVWPDTMRDRYINSNLNNWQNSLAAAEAQSLEISSYRTSLKWLQRLSQWAKE